MGAGEKLERLAEVTKDLRARCPWDKKQTPSSLKPYIIEEAYEVLEAIDSGQPGLLSEELGDLLFQVVIQSEIASEKGQFGIEDVLERITEKMVSRHPHVFGQEQAATAEDVLSRWHELKKKEGKQKHSILEGIPASLPALLRAFKVQKRAGRVGFDWQGPKDVLPKIKEEIAEFGAAMSKNDMPEMEEELGDILFSIVNLARHAGIDPEQALGKSVNKFSARFREIEKEAKKRGIGLSDMGLEEMDAVWEKTKKK
ncbi:MAG: nucleoside triphosphate pyrophosphohydrolase [Nitrospiraceae bacterium]|nr:nucleoside triphosphate pyrophosphohydrolase [Nitrospiraceae bacterium]